MNRCKYLLAFLLLCVVLAPGQTQTTPKVVPKLAPIAETKLLMEGLAHPNFRGIERHLSAQSADEKSWVFARGQALLVAETANLLMIRPPRNNGETAWFDRAMDLRTQANQLAQSLAKRDLASSRTGLQAVGNSCNRCHQSFRVPVDIAPFQQPPDAPPLRKI